ncbi:hypothetical protein [Streptomyces sp. NPDC047981]|uniref:hypothetical protein n=1 Tax=Streptomyces sp. NPDC047981 TaxID=3154610 RepID=UPI0034385A01
MRRPAQPRTAPAAPAWAHPYAGVAALAVFYNDGGNPDPNAQPPAAPPAPKPGPPVPPTVTMSQDDLNALTTKEKDQGRRAGARQALEDFATEHGFGSVDDAKTFITAARQAQQDALSEQERAQQQLAADRAQVDQAQAALAVERRNLVREQTLIRLGALDVADDQGQVTSPNLQDALALLERELRDTPDAEAADVAAAAARVKTRHPALFGAPQAPAPQALPPAPGGGPAGGPPGRTPAGTKDAVKTAARKRAEEMGLRRPDAA